MHRANNVNITLSGLSRCTQIVLRSIRLFPLPYAIFLVILTMFQTLVSKQNT